MTARRIATNFSGHRCTVGMTSELNIPLIRKLYGIFLLTNYVVCLFVCFGYVTALVPHGQFLQRAPLPPRPLVTPGPRCSSYPLSPPYLCHASSIRSVPFPVLLSCTSILPSRWSVPSSPCLPVLHIYLTPWNPMYFTHKENIIQSNNQGKGLDNISG